MYSTCTMNDITIQLSHALVVYMFMNVSQYLKIHPNNTHTFVGRYYMYIGNLLYKRKNTYTYFQFSYTPTVSSVKMLKDVRFMLKTSGHIDAIPTIAILTKK